MKYFAVNYEYNPANPEIAKVRPAHREFTGKLFDEGTIVASGPFTDSQGGALIVVRFDDDGTEVADVIQLMNDDPFYQEGCLQGRSFREWNPVKARF